MVARQQLDRDERRRAYLRGQLGLITTQQALVSGDTRERIRQRVKRREWEAVEHGIYRDLVFPQTRLQTLMAVCLRKPGSIWVSHRTAAELHDLGIRSEETVTVTSTSRLAPVPGVHVHHTRLLAACDRTTISHVPVTAIERTLIDLTADSSDEKLDFALDEALVTHRTSLDKIEWRLRRSGGRGRPGTARLRSLIERRRRFGQVDSQLERMFFRLLDEGRIPRPVLQHPIKLADETVYADFAYPDRRLIIEVLGYRWHGGRKRWENDQRRSSELAAIGWRIMFVTKYQIEHERAEMIRRIRKAVGLEALF